jgi:hypothetical protein
MEANIPTVREWLEANFAPVGGIAAENRAHGGDRLSGRSIAHADVHVDVVQTNQFPPAIEGVLKVVAGIGLAIGKAIQYVEELAPSAGYEPFLIQTGCNPIGARLMAKIAVRSGTRQAKESQQNRPVCDAIRFLAQGNRQRRSIMQRAKILLAAWEETSIIETIFDKAGFSGTEFVSLLKSAIEGRDVERRRIAEIAAALAPFASVSRGRKVSAASAAHQFFLEGIVGLTKSRAYTWSDLEGNFTDPMTRATRLEFKDPDFDPRPAHRRVKAAGKPMSRTA